MIYNWFCVSVRRLLSAILVFSIIFCFNLSESRGQTTLFPDVSLGENLLQNPGFENASSNWTIPAAYASVVSNIRYAGDKSLFFKNTNSQINPTRVTQSLVVSPGQTIYFGVLAKGQGIDATYAASNNYGARIYVQSYDSQGNFINGMYPATTGAGTFDWKEIGGIYTVPINAASISIGIGLMPNVTGEVWFDEVYIKLENDPLYSAFLTKPNYRGMVLNGDKSVWKVDTRITLQTGIPENSYGTYIHALLNSSNDTLKTHQNLIRLSSRDTVLTFEVSDLTLNNGNYRFNTRYYNHLGELVLEKNHHIKVGAAMPKVYIDKEGYTIKNGEKIFPLGVYIGEPDEENLLRVKNAGFNTVLSYSFGYTSRAEAFLDRANTVGVNVIYSLKDMYEGMTSVNIPNPRQTAIDYIDRFKNKPALLSWYTADELLPTWLPKIDTMYKDIIEHDDNHPAFQVHYYESKKMFEKYYYSADIIAADPYPVGRADLTLTTLRNNANVAASHGARGVWSVPQIMDWAIYEKDRPVNPPSLDEMRNQTYQALISGAKGLIYYSYNDLFYTQWPRGESTYSISSFNNRWADVSAMSEEISNITPVLLEGKKAELQVTSNNGVYMSALKYGETLNLLLANPYYTEKNIALQLPLGTSVTQLVQHNISGVVNNGILYLTLPSVASGIYKLDLDSSNGQEPEQQVWKFIDNRKWNYSFNGPSLTNSYYGGSNILQGAGTANAYSYSITTASNSGYLPKAGFGSSLRVQAGGATASGIFSIDSMGQEKPRLNIPIAQAGIPVNKMSFYGIQDATPVLKLDYVFDLTKTPTIGTIGGGVFLVLGNHTAGTTVFTSNGSVSQSPAIFAVFQWLFNTNGTISLRTRKNSGAEYPVLSTTDFVNGGGPYRIEVFANNSNDSKVYQRKGIEFSLPAGKLHFWVNGKRLSINNNVDISNSGDAMPVDTPLNALAFIAAKQNNTQYDNESMAVSNFQWSYGVSDMVTLPVNIISFSGQQMNTGILLSWKTALETGDKEFEIYRSGNNADFSKIGVKKGANNSANLNSYAFLDNLPLMGDNYYKIYQKDHNGNIDIYPETIMINALLKKRNTFFMYYTENGQIKVSIYSDRNEEAYLMVNNILGINILNKALKLSVGNNEFYFSVPYLAKGVYTGQLRSDNGYTRKKFILN